MTLKWNLTALLVPLFAMSVTSFAQDEAQVRRMTSQLKLFADLTAAQRVVDICFSGSPDGRGGVTYKDNSDGCARVRTIVQTMAAQLPPEYSFGVIGR